MRILIEWLQEFVDVSQDIDELTHRLTQIGLEVEEIHRLDDIINEVQVVEVAGVETHPEKQNLKVCEIRSENGSHRVVSAAPGLRIGTRYLWAPPGSQLSNGAVETQKVHGIKSDGVLCSTRELGLTESAHSLLEIPEKFEIGMSAVDILDLDDPIIEIDLTPNRSDCLSIHGIARDLSAANDLELTTPNPPQVPDSPVSDISIEIQDYDKCWDYTGIPIENVSIRPSKFEIQKRLIKMGAQPINNLVDATNYTLFELGHPLHPFDADKLGYPVSIRNAKSGESIQTIDQTEIDLDSDDLVIADNKGPQALAGIMGGLHSEVETTTSNVFLEGAFFDPITVRRTASRHTLHSDASHRFERGVDPNTVSLALARCLEIFTNNNVDDSTLTIKAPVRDQRDTVPSVTVNFNPDSVNDLIGYDPGQSEIEGRLKRLGCTIEKDDTWTVNVPSWRHDLTREEDLIEEIVRLDGYESIQSNFPEIQLNETSSPSHFNRQYHRIRDKLSALGFFETLNFSFLNKSQNQFREADQSRTLRNPLSKEHESMRQSILDGLLNCAINNIEDGFDNLRLFEVGRVFPPDTETELTNLGLLACGHLYDQNWGDNDRDYDVYDLKGVLDIVCSRLNLPPLEYKPDKLPGFHPNRCARITLSDTNVGRIGQINPELIKLDGDRKIYAAELTLSALPEPSPVEYTDFSEQPTVNRDLDLVVDSDIYIRDIKKLIQSNAKWLEEIKIFDLYHGDPLPDGKKSVSFNLKFRSRDRTLKNEEVNTVQENILDALRNEFGDVLREE